MNSVASAQDCNIDGGTQSLSKDLNLAAFNLPSRHAASISKGVLFHGEHFPDLVLVQGATSDSRFFTGFRAMTYQVLRALETGRMDVNEKIDGSPSILIGLNPEGKPFVAYKGGFEAVRTQKLFCTREDVLQEYGKGQKVKDLYLDCVKFLIPRIKEVFKGEFSELIVQGDLLFTAHSDRKRVTSGGIEFKPNTLTYGISNSHPLFATLNNSYVAIAIHSISTRHLNKETGRLTLSAYNDPGIIREIATKLASPAVAVVHPWKDATKLDRVEDFDALAKKIRGLLKDIEVRLSVLGSEFSEKWNDVHLDITRIFLNSGLKPPHRGGFYKAAANGELFEMRRFVEGMRQWIREQKVKPNSTPERRAQYRAYAKQFDFFVLEHHPEFCALMEAYYRAVQIQSILGAQLRPALASKLGGGPSEGFMLAHKGVVAKWVDRLDFTMRNNANWQRTASTIANLPEPFDKWREGAHVVPMKLQPPHAGHVEMLKLAVKHAAGKPVFVIASIKEPNLNAKTWEELGAGKAQSAAVDGRYTHMFSNALRKEILAAAGVEGAEIYFLDTGILEVYLNRAHWSNEKGRITLVAGEKELSAGRYADLLAAYPHLVEPLFVPPQQGGVSASEVRGYLKSYVTMGDMLAYRSLDTAFSYIKDDLVRKTLIQKLALEWHDLHEKAKSLVRIKVKKRASGRKVEKN